MTKALILGRGDGVWNEMEAAKALADFDCIIATNRVGRDYPGMVQHWVSFHPELFTKWIIERKQKGLPDQPAQLWSGIYRGHRVGRAVDARIESVMKYVSCEGGSTGLLAVMVAVRELKIERSVLCGIPLEKTPRYDDETPWSEGHTYRNAWKENYAMMEDTVRSMSGWTQQLLGAPTKEWLDVADC